MTSLIERLGEALGLPLTSIQIEGIGSMTYVQITLDEPYSVSMVGIMVEIIREFKLTACEIQISYGATVMAMVTIDKENHTVNEYFKL